MERQITRKQQALIINMLSSGSMDDACRASGVSRSTAYRWMKTDSTFRREFSDAKAAAFSEAVAELSKSATTVAKVLTEIATDKSAPVTGRVSASRAIFEWAHRSLETESLAADARELADELRKRKAKRHER